MMLCFMRLASLLLLLSAVSQPLAAQTLANSPHTKLFAALLQCDASWFTALADNAGQLDELPALTRSAQGVSYLAVPDRRDAANDGQSIALVPPLRVVGLAFSEFIDEVNVFETQPEASYYWGLNTEAPLARVLPLVQALVGTPKLTADGGTWARLSQFAGGRWQFVADHAALKGKPASLPERVLIVETHEGGGTRVVCGIQGAAIPRAELEKLRPDLQGVK